MMQAEEINAGSGEDQLHPSKHNIGIDDHDLEKAPLLPVMTGANKNQSQSQHDQHAIQSQQAYLRSRRRGVSSSQVDQNDFTPLLKDVDANKYRGRGEFQSRNKSHDLNYLLNTSLGESHGSLGPSQNREVLEVQANHEYEYYFDDTNDQSWACSFGTDEGDGIWMNRGDQAGAIMSIIVWILIAYSGITITLLAESNHLSRIVAIFYCTICALALASHAKTMFSDPGAIPQCAVPVDSAARRMEAHTMCSTCRSFKPPGSHHCRICDRCISKMDHHCPWMNNCIGATNNKYFILFLAYTWVGSAMALIIFGINYFLCENEKCEFSGVLVQLVRVMTVICSASLLFTSSMLSNVTYGVMTGMGTIDRIKIQTSDSMDSADEDPISLEDIFGIGSFYTWFLPMEPIYSDYDEVVGYSMPQRLLREGNNDNASDC